MMEMPRIGNGSATEINRPGPDPNSSDDLIPRIQAKTHLGNRRRQ
jgi:hypothetical protein